MAFSEFELARIHSTVGKLVARRQSPAALRDKLRLELEVDGHAVTIWEVRPAWRGPGETRTGIARLRFTRTRGTWTLYWMRSDLKRHEYYDAEPTAALDRLVAVVEDDASCAFFG